MIDQHERDRIRKAISDILDLAPELSDRSTDTTALGSRRRGAGSTRRTLVAVAAVTVGAVGLAGLYLVAGRNSPTAPTSSAAPGSTAPGFAAARPLSSVEVLAASEWVIASTLPDSTEYLYAFARGDETPSDVEQRTRAIAYGQPRGDGTDEQLWVETGRGPIGGSNDTLTIDGVDWSTGSSSPGWWSASRLVGETSVSVRGSGDLDEDVLRGLVVIDQDDLPFAPLGDRDDAAIVARTEVGDVTYTYAVQVSGGYSCHWISTADGVSGGCASRLDPDAVVTIDGGSISQMVDRPDIADVVRSGSVTATATLVEVEFADGTKLGVEPTDLSGTFDRLFWIAAATISTDSQTGLPVTEEAVADVRAYDRAGNLLGSAVPPLLEASPPPSTVPDPDATVSSSASVDNWECRALVYSDDTIESIAARFDVEARDLTERFGPSADWLVNGGLVDAPCGSVAGWQGGEVTTVVETPVVFATAPPRGLEPSARLFGLGASAARVEVGPVVDDLSRLHVDVYQGDGDLHWGGGLGVDNCVGGLRFDDPPVTVDRTPVVRLRCAEPDMQVSIGLLDESISIQTNARVVVANNSDIGGIAGWLTNRLSDLYPIGEAVNAGPDAPDETTVLYRSGFELAAEGLSQRLASDGQNVPTAPIPDGDLSDQSDGEFDVLIVLGNDFDPAP